MSGQSNQRTYSIRLELKDGQVVKAELQDVAKVGDKSLKSLGERASDAAKKLTTLKGASQALGLVARGFTALVGGALAVGGAFLYLEKRAFDAAGEIKDMSAQANMSATKFQEYRYLAVQLGIEFGSLTDGFNRFVDAADDFATTGGGSAAAAFKRLGLSQREVNTGLNNSEELFQKVIQKIRETGDEATKISLANSLFGKSGGKDFLLMIKESGTEIERLRQEAHKLGLIMSDEMIEKADGASDKLGALAYILDTKVKVALIENSDAIIDLVNAVVDNLPAAIDKVLEFGRAVGLIDPNSKSSVTSLGDLRKELERNEDLLNRINSGQIASTGGQSVDVLKGNLEKKIADIKAKIDGASAPSSAGSPPKGNSGSGGGRSDNISNKESDGIRDKIEAMREELRIGKESERQQAALRAERALGTEATAAQKREARDLAYAIYDQNEAIEKAKDRANDYTRAVDSVAGSIDNGLEDALRGNIRSWEDWENTLIDIFANVAIQMMKINNTSAGGSLGSVFATGILDAFGLSSDTATAAAPAGRASGGPVTKGTLYRVNEREQEYWSPPDNGRIIPESKLGMGGGDVNITLNNNTSSKVSVESKQNGSNKDILIMIDEANASNILSKNSATRKALNQVVNPEILRR